MKRSPPNPEKRDRTSRVRIGLAVALLLAIAGLYLGWSEDRASDVELGAIDTGEKRAALRAEVPIFEPSKEGLCRVRGTVAPRPANRVVIHAAGGERDVDANLAPGGRAFEAEVEGGGPMLFVATTDDGDSAESSASCSTEGRLEVALRFHRAGDAMPRAIGRCLYLGTGGPAKGAVVRARLRGMSSERLGLDEKLAFSALADDRGAFAVRAPAGSYLVRCTKDMDESEEADLDLAPGLDRELELAIAPGTVLVGRVIREDGEGVAGAHVSGRASTYFSPSSAVREATTDREGRFRLVGLPVGPVRIEAEADDRFAEADAVVRAELPYRELALQLSAGMMIRGRISGRDGRAIEGATVGLETLRGGFSRAPIERRTRSGADGRYLLGGLVPGHYAVFASAPGHLSRRIEVGEIKASYDFDLDLFEACPRSVRVMPALPKAPIALTAEPADGTSPSRSFTGETGAPIAVTDMAGPINLYARTVGAHARSATRAVDLCAVEGDLDLDLERGGSAAIEAVVERAGGERLAGIEVSLSRERLRATTDERGRAVFEGLSAGQYYVRAGDTGEAVEVEAGGRAEVKLTVDRAAGEVSGVVVAMGRPVEGASIRASCRDSGWQAQLRDAPLVARSDVRGAFAFAPKSGSVCLVRAEHPTEGASEPTTLKVGGLPANIELRPMGTIAGRALELAGGRPLSPYTLTMRAEGRASDADLRTVYVSDSNGRFRVEGVAPGLISLFVTGPGGKGHTELELSPGEAKEGVEIGVRDQGLVVGRVVGPAGPIAGASVVLRSARSGRGADGRDEGDSRGAAVAGEDGRFELRAEAGDPLRLYASAPRFYPWGSAPFDLDGRGGTTDVGAVELSPRGADAEKEGGIGIQFAPDPKGVRVVRLLDDSPARDAGIEVGDVIVAIDSMPAGRLALVNWVVMLRGPVGSPVVLVLERGTEPPRSATVIRRAIGLDAVPTDPL
jgi:PDZ domain-containing protein/carboxypeptidase family protein